MRMVKIENERNTFMETDSGRRDEVSPTIIASRKILGFVISDIHLFHGTHKYIKLKRQQLLKFLQLKQIHELFVLVTVTNFGPKQIPFNF